MTEVTYFLLGDFPCSIHKSGELGHLCGYLGVPHNHPWYGKDYDEVNADVHGGLTYFGHERLGFYPSKARTASLLSVKNLGRWSDEERAQFEALPRWDSEEQEPFPHDTGLDVWWLGFDCAHAGDFVPGMGSSASGSYKDEAYVFAELERLATQAAQAVEVK